MNTFIEFKSKDFHLKELLSGGSTALAFKVAGMFLNYAFVLLITRNLGADTMGVFALSLTFLSLLTVFGSLGVETALLRFVTEYRTQQRNDLISELYKKIVKLIIPFCIFLSVMTYLLSPIIAADIFRKAYLTPYLRIISLAVLPMVLIQINSQVLRAYKNIKGFSFFQDISHYLFAIIFLLFFLLFTKQQYIVFFSYISGIVLSSALCFMLLTRKIELKAVHHGETIPLKNILKISTTILMISLMSFFMNWIEIFILGLFRSDSEIGVYNVASQIASFSSITLIAINTIAAQKFAEFNSKNDMDGLERTVKHSTKLIFWTSAPILLIIFILPSSILGIFGNEFKTGVYALLFLSFGQFINAISGSVGLILLMTGREKVFYRIVMVTALLKSVLNIAIIPEFGMEGAAFVGMTSMIFWNISSVIFIKRHFNILTLYIPFIKKLG